MTDQPGFITIALAPATAFLWLAVLIRWLAHRRQRRMLDELRWDTLAALAALEVDEAELRAFRR